MNTKKQNNLLTSFWIFLIINIVGGLIGISTVLVILSNPNLSTGLNFTTISSILTISGIAIVLYLIIGTGAYMYFAKLRFKPAFYLLLLGGIIAILINIVFNFISLNNLILQYIASYLGIFMALTYLRKKVTQ